MAAANASAYQRMMMMNPMMMMGMNPMMNQMGAGFNPMFAVRDPFFIV